MSGPSGNSVADDKEEMKGFVRRLRSTMAAPVTPDSVHRLFLSMDLYRYCEYLQYELMVPDMNYIELMREFYTYPVEPPAEDEDNYDGLDDGDEEPEGSREGALPPRTVGDMESFTLGDMLMLAADYIYSSDYPAQEKYILRGYKIVYALLLKPYETAGR
ncbi:MAG: hypothetical protein IJ806_01185 [Ruminococcus sp.]|nr:hypothetical protein [Ruminococcus sp.]MBR1862687.1 hypothetical protein [Ruminococcus sp.]